MKAVVDTNVFISFLLGGSLESPPTRAVLLGIDGAYTIAYSHRLIAELERRIATKPYLAERIPESILAVFVETLMDHGDSIDAEPDLIPKVSRDRNDDFLLIDSVIADADYLVTGDQDLLVLDVFESVRIVSPAAFVALLDQTT